MGQRPRPKPKRLAAKLLALRRALRLSQSELATALTLELSPARLSEYENGIREPSLVTLLRYARVAGIPVEVLIDDKMKLNTVEIRRKHSPQ